MPLGGPKKWCRPRSIRRSKARRSVRYRWANHASPCARKIAAVMWTDTSEFRNHNYHRHTDTPHTLNYRFLRQVTQLLTACVIQQVESDLIDED